MNYASSILTIQGMEAFKEIIDSDVEVIRCMKGCSIRSSGTHGSTQSRFSRRGEQIDSTSATFRNLIGKCPESCTSRMVEHDGDRCVTIKTDKGRLGN